MTDPSNSTADYDLASAVADNAMSMASTVGVSLTLMVLHLRKSGLEFPSAQESRPLGDGYTTGFKELSRVNVRASFVWRTSWNFRGYLAWNDTSSTFNLGSGVAASTEVPMEISFERVCYRNPEGGGLRWSIENLVLRKGPGEVRLPWSTEVKADIEVVSRYNETTGERYLELRFTWKEYGRLTNSERLAHLFLHPGHTPVTCDEGFAAAIGDQHDALMTMLTNDDDDPAVGGTADRLRINIADSSSES